MHCGEVAQLVERPKEVEVAGSSPALPTSCLRPSSSAGRAVDLIGLDMCPRSSAVEHLTCNEGVIGSNPIGGLLSNNPSNSIKKGDTSTAHILFKLLQHGWVVLQPWGVGHRYDLVRDHNGVFSRIQCKTRSHYRGQIEYFGVHCLDTSVSYLVPVDIASKTTTRMRVQPTRNGQLKHVIWARDYEL